MKSKYLCLLIFMALAVGCGSGQSGEQVQPMLATPEPTGEGANSVSSLSDNLGSLLGLPPLNDTSSLYGSDSDQNGVRDEIDEYISSLSLDAETRAAVVNVAAALQRVVATTGDSDQAQAIAIDVITYVQDVYGRVGSSAEAVRVLSLLESATFNTDARTAKYLEYNESLNDSVYRLQ